MAGQRVHPGVHLRHSPCALPPAVGLHPTQCEGGLHRQHRLLPGAGHLPVRGHAEGEAAPSPPRGADPEGRDQQGAVQPSGGVHPPAAAPAAEVDPEGSRAVCRVLCGPDGVFHPGRVAEDATSLVAEFAQLTHRAASHGGWVPTTAGHLPPSGSRRDGQAGARLGVSGGPNGAPQSPVTAGGGHTHTAGTHSWCTSPCTSALHTAHHTQIRSL